MVATRLCRESTPVLVWAALAVALAVPATSQTPKCTLEHLDPALPYRLESVNESLGDWRFQCSGFGGSIDVNVFFDGQFTNRALTVSGREIVTAMAIVEGTTPDAAVYQVPGQPPVPGANVFLLEKRDDLIGERLFASGLPGNVPLILTGARADISVGQSAALQRALGAGTRDFSVSGVAGGGSVVFDQVAVPALMMLPPGETPVEFDENGNPQWVFSEAFPSAFRSAGQERVRGNDFAESPGYPPVDIAPPWDDSPGVMFIAAFLGAVLPIQADEVSTVLALAREPERLNYFAPTDRTFAGGNLPPADEPPIFPFEPNGEGTAVVGVRIVQPLSTEAIDRFEIPFEVRCRGDGEITYSLEVRTTLGPISADRAPLLFDPRPTPIQLSPGDGQLPILAFETDIFESDVFTSLDLTCQPELQPPLFGGLVGAADFSMAAPGGLAAIGGENFSQGIHIANTIGVTQLGLTEVFISSGEGSFVRAPLVRRAAAIRAPLLFVSPNQINFQIPWEVDDGSGRAMVVVRSQGLDSEPTEVALPRYAPALFTFDFGPGRAIAIHPADGVLAHADGALADLELPSRAALPGDFLLLLGTGFGPTNPPGVTGDDSFDDLGNFIRRDLISTPRVLIGGVESPVLFAGLSPQFMGVTQINIQVPAGVEPGDQVSIVVEVEGVRSGEDVTIAVGTGAPAQ